jgi:hypothetical protein
MKDREDVTAQEVKDETDSKENLSHYSKSMLKLRSKMLMHEQIDEKLQQESLDQLSEK